MISVTHINQQTQLKRYIWKNSFCLFVPLNSLESFELFSLETINSWFVFYFCFDGNSCLCCVELVLCDNRVVF
jgi:hypothetical protein